MPARAAASSNSNSKKHLDLWDVGRMIKFIEQEAEQKAHEIEIKAKEQYAIEIAEYTIRNIEKCDKEKSEEMAKIKAEKTIAEGKLRSKATICMAKEKEKACFKLMQQVYKSCENIPLSKSLAKTSINKFQFILPEEKMIIYVKQVDRATIEPFLTGKDYSIHNLDDKLLGGIVIHNQSRTLLINSSYMERARKSEIFSMPEIQRRLFK
ncbi:V-type H+-transporting ATPase subunit E [Nematocida sp. LUAm3]|nr:V-type H+-transporting ATPase subunit E [Nematocida sp. LUAm3]KAI5173693.1 V-type H+-transporting ATPase subunit E [Nematocida sp. LUAm2]KAI5176915.1 V-type H+-transporting ATPase subunit E [Nematocida sp. LUAm1]